MMKKRNELLKEEYELLVLDNGLRLYLMPKNDFKQTFAVLSTKYGSIYNTFISANKQDYVSIPLGVAHFLEHKLFEQSDGTDATDLFSSLGADVNAYTTYDQTAFIFSATDNILKCVKLLLEFVYSPYFTKESVSKECKIITQELLMYLDRPQTMIYNYLNEAMYEKNAVRYDIGGTVKSIKEITVNNLFDAYNTFYHPANMTLTIVGCFNKKEVIKEVNAFFSNRVFNQFCDPQTIFYDESDIVFKNYDVRRGDVFSPKIIEGVKIKPFSKSNLDLLKYSLYFDILVEMFYGPSSNNYINWLNEGIIDYSFDYSSTYEKHYANISLCANSFKYKELIEIFKQSLLSLKNEIIDEKLFNHFVRLQKAQFIRKFNSVESIAYLITDFDIDNIDFMSSYKVIDELNIMEFKSVLMMIKEESISTVVILPNKKEC